MRTFLFYDLETTGLSKPFDQILQFAAIRTDMAFQELERHEWRVRLNPDVTPAPEALLTHRLDIHDIQNGLPEYDAVKRIHALINTPETISLGYNTLGFDDEFLRFSFYRNLLAPYTHQFANRCGRMDLYPITLMYWLFRDSLLTWPVKNGKLSLKLESLNEANHLAEGKAHDAMADVQATVALARRLSADENMWNYLAGSFEKKTDLERMQALLAKPALFIRPRLGAADQFQCPVLFLGEHRHYRNQLVWLRLDSPALRDTTLDTLSRTTFALSKKPGEPDFLLPLETRFTKHLSAARQLMTEDNLKWLACHPDLLDTIKDFHLNFKWPSFPETDAEARLYLDGFYSPPEDQFCRQFAQASLPAEKAKLAERAPQGKLQQLAARVIARSFPEAMTPALSAIYAEFEECRLSSEESQLPVDHQGRRRLGPKEALAAIQALSVMPERTADDMRILEEYANWLKTQTVTRDKQESL